MMFEPVAAKARIMAGLLTILFGAAAQAAADPLHIEATFVRQDGSAYANQPVRIVVGSMPEARLPEAGHKLVTDSEGKVVLDLDAQVATRRVSLDVWFIRHKANFLEIGVELDLLGKPALYWIELDQVRQGTVGLMKAFVAGDDGRFDRMLEFHPETHSWSIPGDPQGLVMTDIGADLKFHEMEGESGKGWTVRLAIEKQEFTVR